MADKTSIPNLAFINVATPSAPRITLLNDSKKGSSTAKLSSGITDKDGNAPTLEMMLTFKNTEGKYLQCTVPAAGFTSSTTITNMKRGIAKSGIDLATEVSALDIDLLEGSEVVSAIPAQLFQLLYDAFRGTIATGGANFRIGLGTDVDITLYAQNADANKPFMRYDKTNNKWIFSNDGVSSTDVGGGTGTITAGDGIDIAAGVVSLDIRADRGLIITSTELDVELKANGGVLVDADGFYLDQSNIKIGEDVAVTATSTEINQALDGISANVTDTNLNTLTAGAASDGDALHTHANLSFYAGVGAALVNKDYYNFNIPILISTNVPSGDFWTNTGYTLNTEAPQYINVSNAGAASFITDYEVSPFVNFSSSKKVIVEFELQFNGVGAAEGAFGLVEGTANLNDYNDQTEDAASFSYENGTLYAHTADAGVGSTETDISAGITINNRNTYRIEFDGGVNVKFYVNGTLKATHTTNLPNSASIKFGWGSSANGNDPSLITTPYFSIEK